MKSVTNFKPLKGGTYVKRMKKITLLIGLTILVTLAFSGVAFAAQFTMPGVPQDAGIADKPYSEFEVSECRVCHGDNTADRHHNNDLAKPDPVTLETHCNACHKVVDGKLQTGTEFDRNCFNCHTSSPHHTTYWATGGECTKCHSGSVLADPGTGLVAPEKPEYAVSLITPTPKSCTNCHSDYPTVGTDSNEQSHHDALAPDMTNLTNCNFCHDFTLTRVVAPIRMCESCHTISSLHNIDGHVYNVDPDTGEKVFDNNRCVGCHSDYVDDLPPMYPLPPNLIELEKNAAKSFEYIYIYGEGFDVPGDKAAVYFEAEDGTQTKASYNIWYDDQIRIMVPNVAPGDYTIFVTTPAGESDRLPFNVIQPPVIKGLTPNKGLAGSQVTIKGTGFLNNTSEVKFSTSGGSFTLTQDDDGVLGSTEFQVVDDATIIATVPKAAPSAFLVTVTTDAGKSNAATFTIGLAPNITYLSPSSGNVGKTVIIYGTNFGTTKGTVKFVDGTKTYSATITYWTSTRVYVTVPAIPKPTTGTTKAVSLVLNNGIGDSKAMAFTVKY